MFCWSETLQLLQQPWGQDHHDQEEGGRRMEPPVIHTGLMFSISSWRCRC